MIEPNNLLDHFSDHPRVAMTQAICVIDRVLNHILQDEWYEEVAWDAARQQLTEIWVRFEVTYRSE